jgi:hypothetical protein
LCSSFSPSVIDARFSKLRIGFYLGLSPSSASALSINGKNGQDIEPAGKEREVQEQAYDDEVDDVVVMMPTR